MKVRAIVGVALVAVLVSMMATIAMGAGPLTVTPRASVVMYPRPAHLVVTTPLAVPQAITVQARAVGGTWITVRTISASSAALGTTFTVSPKLRLTSGIRAVQGEFVSAVVTVGVKARLAAVRVIRHKGVYTMKGTISPAHTRGTDIGLHVWKRTGKGRDAVLVALPDITGSVYRRNGQISWWRASFDPDGKGTYVVRAFHEDDGHLLSVSRAKTFKVRH